MSSFLSIMPLSLSLSHVYVFYVQTTLCKYLQFTILFPWGSELNWIVHIWTILKYYWYINVPLIMWFCLFESILTKKNLYFKIHFNTSQIQTSNPYTGKGSNSILYFEVSSSFVISVQDPGFLNYVPFVILCQSCLDRCTTVIHNVG